MWPLSAEFKHLHNALAPNSEQGWDSACGAWRGLRVYSSLIRLLQRTTLAVAPGSRCRRSGKESSATSVLCPLRAAAL